MTISAGIKEALESESGVPEMNRWKSRQLSEAVQLFLIAFAAIGLLWAALERLIYGEIQPRIVDDLISLAWSGMAWCAYYLGREHERRTPRT